jgi:hypothetical protein
MRRSPDQIAQDYAYVQQIAKNRALNTATLSADHAERLSQAVVGSEYTNPEITATLGLSDTPVDMAAIHKAAQNQYTNEAVHEDKRPLNVTHSPLTPTGQQTQTIPPGGSHGSYRVMRDGTEGKTLWDVLQMKQTDFMVQPGHKPAWWEVVDPTNEQGMNWRNITVPNPKTPEDLLKLSEPELIKYWAQNKEEYAKLSEQFRPTMAFIKDGKVIRGGNVSKGTGPVIPDPTVPLGHQDLIDQKFPVFANLRQTYEGQQWAIQNANQPTGFAADIATLRQDLAPVGWLAGLVPRTLGMLTPDHIGLAGGIQAGGVNIPLRVDLTKLGTAARAASKTIVAGFTGAAQFTKSNLEYLMTHGGIDPLTGLPSAALPGEDHQKNMQDFVHTVIQGNVLTQIIKRGLDPNKNLDLGGGFFPEGPTVELARKEHDAGLPKIAGKTFTAGRAIEEPFIQAGLIDRNGYAATIISGLADMTFTLATDPAMYFDPIQSIMKGFNLGHVASTKLLDGAIADRVREAWSAERTANNASTVVRDVIDMVFDKSTGTWVHGGQDIPVGELPKFGGMLPEGSALPKEIEAIVKQQADEIIANHNLSIMDSPPDASFKASIDSPSSIKSSLGIVPTTSGSARLNPMAIDAMPYTRTGRAALSKLGSFDNVGQLYDAFLGDIPIGAAQDIQDIVDAARRVGIDPDLTAIHKVITDGILKGDPLYHTFKVPGIQSQWVDQTGAMIANQVAGRTRQFATMPGSTFFSFEDPMASIKDMNNLMIVMKIPTADRHGMLAEAIRAVTKEGPGARFDLANRWMDTMVGPSLRKQGVPEEWIKSVTKWSGWSDGIHKWSMDAFGRGYPTPWLEDGSTEIFRTLDGLNSGFIMVHPDMLKQVIRNTTNLWKVLKPIRGNAVVDKLLRPTYIDKLENIQGGLLKPLALGAPLPIRMATRIVPDELIRVIATGELSPESLQMLGTFGHVRYDTYGVIIRSSKEITKIVPRIQELDRLEIQLTRAVQAGDTTTASRVQKYIDSIEQKHGTRQEMQAEIDLNNERINTNLPGANHALAQNIQGLMADELADPKVAHWNLSNNIQDAHVVDHPEQWITGTARDIVRMNANPEYPPIAEAMLNGQVAINQLADRFLTGDLKPVLQQFIRSNGKRNAAWDWTDINNVKYWVASRMEDIANRTAQEHEAINAVATGSFAGKPISAGDPWKLFEPTQEFRQYVADVVHQSPNRSEIAPFAPSEATEVTKQKSQILTKGFKIYRDVSAKMARNPFTQYHKWKTIIELMPTMDPAEARAMADAIDKTDAPKWLKEQLADGVAGAAGTTTRKQAEILGEMAGQKEMTDLLYDSSKKSYFGYRHSLNFGFFDAWKEQWAVWTRLLATQPSLLYKAGLVQKGLENTKLPEWAGGMPNQGILYTDPDTGKQAVAVPFSRWVMKGLGLEGNESIGTKNLTLLGQSVPGAFGFGGMIWDFILPTTEQFAGVRNTLFPFGNPKVKGRLGDYFLPAWGQGFATAAGSLMGIDTIQQMFSTDQNDATRATTLNAVLSNLAYQKGNIPITDEERVKLLEEAKNKTNLLLMYKAAMKVFLPGASITKYYAQLGPQYATQGQVLNDLRDMTADPKKLYADGVNDFLNKWGQSAWVYLSGSSTASPGIQPTKEFAKWSQNNSGLIGKYPLVAAFLGPQGGTFDPNAYSEQRNMELRNPKDAEKRMNDSLNNVAWAIHNRTKEKLINKGIDDGLTPNQVKNSPYFEAQIKRQDDLLKQIYPMWDPNATGSSHDLEWVNQKIQITRMIKDKKVLSLPAGAALKEYWDYRVRNIEAAKGFNPKLANDAWITSNDGAGLRNKLTEQANGLIVKYPEFKYLWERVLSNEFPPAEMAQ